MVDRINASVCVKTRARKWELLPGIDKPELRERGQTPLGRKRSCRRNCLLMNVHAYNGTAGGGGDPQRRASGSTGNIEQLLVREKIEPDQELVLFLSSKPTVLYDVFAKGFATDLLIEFRLEISVVGVVVTLAKTQFRFRFVDSIDVRTSRRLFRVSGHAWGEPREPWGALELTEGFLYREQFRRGMAASS
jgi:hypothetical protein